MSTIIEGGDCFCLLLFIILCRARLTTFLGRFVGGAISKPASGTTLPPSLPVVFKASWPRLSLLLELSPMSFTEDVTSPSPRTCNCWASLLVSLISIRFDRTLVHVLQKRSKCWQETAKELKGFQSFSYGVYNRG